MNSDTFRADVRSLLARHPPPTDGPPMSAADLASTATMQRFEAGYVAKDPQAIVSCFAPDVEWRLPTGRVLRGRAETQAFLQERFADPAGPRFSDSRLRVFGNTVVQTYRVGVPRPDGSVSDLEGCDIYRVRDGLITHKDAYWKQLPPLPTAAEPAATAPTAAAAPGLSVPLVVTCAASVARLSDMLLRLLASPLADATAQAGLRFELRVQPGAGGCGDRCSCGTTDRPPAASAPTGAARATSPTATTPLLRGVVTERDVKALPADCRVVATAPRAVITPLARDALRQRGIAVHAPQEV
jgi:ketosteroid isomerase-like protein